MLRDKVIYYKSKLAQAINTDDYIAILGYTAILEEETTKFETALTQLLAANFPATFSIYIHVDREVV